MAADNIFSITEDDLFKFKHDIKNQLSNIQLALEGLKFECEDTNEDLQLYISSLSESARKIDILIDNFK
ncbi:hypothetical protein ACFQZX_15875 [Mucilaginibacter litoreus]|uniref:Histidine kinase n=1 Tax=Mucilaginibacter litoreus TaxID=1048221 RepID=A0ABW3AVM2_9SPHI